MQEEKKKKTPKNGLIYLLISFTLLLAFYSFKKASDYNKLEDIFRLEQAELKEDLDELIEDYKDLSIKKKSISKRLVTEMNKIVSLRDSISDLKASNYNLIHKYRKRIATLERENRDLFAKVDSLKVENHSLKNQNLIVTHELTKKDSAALILQEKNEALRKSKSKLAKKVAIAGIIKTSPISAIAMKERSSGKLTSTSRSSRTDAFRVNFKLLENKITTPGRKKVHVQILDKNKNVVASKGAMKLSDGSKVVYTDELIADYQNDELNILSLVLVNRDDITKGEYRINAYVDGRYTGSTMVKLR